MASIKYIDHKQVTIFSIDLSGNPNDYELNDVFAKAKQLIKINRNEIRMLFRISGIKISELLITHLSALMVTFGKSFVKQAFIINDRSHERLIDFLANRHTLTQTTKVFNNIIDAFNYLSNDERGWGNFKQYQPPKRNIPHNNTHILGSPITSEKY